MFSSLTLNADYWISCCSLRDASLCFIIIVWYTKRETNIHVNIHKTYYGYVHMHTQTHRAVWKLFVMRRWLWSDLSVSCLDLEGHTVIPNVTHARTQTHLSLSLQQDSVTAEWQWQKSLSVPLFLYLCSLFSCNILDLAEMLHDQRYLVCACEQFLWNNPWELAGT